MFDSLNSKTREYDWSDLQQYSFPGFSFSYKLIFLSRFIQVATYNYFLVVMISQIRVSLANESLSACYG